MITTPLDLSFDAFIFPLAQVFFSWAMTALAPLFALVIAFVFILPYLIKRLRLLMGYDILLYSQDGASYSVPASEWQAIKQAEAARQGAELARGSVDIYGMENLGTSERYTDTD